MIVNILLVEHYLEEELGLLLEVTNDLVVVSR